MELDGAVARRALRRAEQNLLCLGEGLARAYSRMRLDRVGQGNGALAPDGALDGSQSILLRATTFD